MHGQQEKRSSPANQVFGAWTAVLQMNKHLLKHPGQQRIFILFHECQNAKKAPRQSDTQFEIQFIITNSDNTIIMEMKSAVILYPHNTHELIWKKMILQHKFPLLNMCNVLHNWRGIK